MTKRGRSPDCAMMTSLPAMPPSDVGAHRVDKFGGHGNEERTTTTTTSRCCRFRASLEFEVQWTDAEATWQPRLSSLHHSLYVALAHCAVGPTIRRWLDALSVWCCVCCCCCYWVVSITSESLGNPCWVCAWELYSDLASRPRVVKGDRNYLISCCMFSCLCLPSWGLYFCCVFSHVLLIFVNISPATGCRDRNYICRVGHSRVTRVRFTHSVTHLLSRWFSDTAIWHFLYQLALLWCLL